MKNKVAIVGMARTTIDEAPWDDDSWEIWVINESNKVEEINQYYERIDRWFQLHPYWDFSRRAGVAHPEYLNWLKEAHPFPIYMQKVYKSIPSSVRFPFKKVFKWAPDHLKDYYTCTFVYQIGFALYIWSQSKTYPGFDDKSLALYGIEMGSKTEILEGQKSAVESWASYAAGLGVDLVLPETCKLFTGPRHPRKYAYEQIPEVHRHHLEIRSEQGKREAEKILPLVNELIDEFNALDVKDKCNQERYHELYTEIAEMRRKLYRAIGWSEACDHIQAEVDDTIYRFENPAEDA